MLDGIIKWDQELLVYLNNLGSEPFDSFWLWVTNMYTWIPLFLLFFILIYIKYPKKEVFPNVVTIVLLIVFITLASYITKELVQRLRPNNAEEIKKIIRILRPPTDYSFFSGHSSSSFSIITIVVLLLRKKIKWVWVFYLWPFLFAYSRIYVGVHYPLDLIIGGIVGVVSANGFYWLHKKFILPYLVLDHRE